MDRTTVARNLQPLERHGLVATAPGEDRRTRVAFLTEQGAEVLKEGMPLWLAAQAQVLGELDEEEWQALRRVLAKAVAAASQRYPKRRWI